MATKKCFRSITKNIVDFSWVDTGNKLAVNVIWHQCDDIAYTRTYTKVGGHDNDLQGKH